MLRFAFFGFALGDFERDFFRLISSNDANIAESVECPLRDNIVGIEEAFSDRCKAEMNSSWASFFSFACQCQFARLISEFRLGNLPGIFRVSSKTGFGCIREELSDLERV